MEKKKVRVNRLKTRDYLVVLIICGVTKAAVHVDRKKDLNRRACRGWRKDHVE